MKKNIILISSLVLVNLLGPSKNIKASSPSLKEYKNVILFIGDGMGVNHVDAAGLYQGEPLCFDVTDENWTYHAYSNTDSRTSEGFTLDTTKSLLDPNLNSSLYDGTPSPYSEEGEKLGTSGNITTYTDSAAGGSALACGIKFTNSRIGMDIDGSPVENLVEIAHKLNKKTGVVTSDELTGATPSDFLVHVGERHLSKEIINGVANSPVDLVLAKNTSTYKENQSDYETLFSEKGFDNITYSKEALNIEANRILGLFDGVMPKTDPRGVPTLAELTAFSLDYLDNDNGFFLMVEGANIDKKAHSNQTIGMLNELLGFNDAVKTAANWANERDDTLIVVTADHETGAMYYDKEKATKETIVDDIKWLSYNHSRARVDIAIYGDIQDYIKKYGDSFSTLSNLPYWDNTDVFKLCATYL